MRPSSPDRPWPRQLAIRPVGMPGGHVQRTRVQSCPRHAASINLGFVHGLDVQSMTTRQGALGPAPCLETLVLWLPLGRPRAC